VRAARSAVRSVEPRQIGKRQIGKGTTLAAAVALLLAAVIFAFDPAAPINTWDTYRIVVRTTHGAPFRHLDLLRPGELVLLACTPPFSARFRLMVAARLAWISAATAGTTARTNASTATRR
jgi:hypothetical protein